MRSFLMVFVMSFGFQSLAFDFDGGRVLPGNCGTQGCGESTSDEELVESIASHEKFLDQLAELDLEVSGKILADVNRSPLANIMVNLTVPTFDGVYSSLTWMCAEVQLLDLALDGYDYLQFTNGRGARVIYEAGPCDFVSESSSGCAENPALCDNGGGDLLN
ncbi:MAG: hypothetical protein HRT45_07910 [Bdellovibrionales bacterium]|nr:hypothetical protein [Bdellovibrionales bacterium]